MDRFYNNLVSLANPDVRDEGSNEDCGESVAGVWMPGDCQGGKVDINPAGVWIADPPASGDYKGKVCNSTVIVHFPIMQRRWS